MTSALDVRQRLLDTDSNFRRLAHKHQEYDERLQELRARRYLSDEEKLEEVRLKKLKLALKDQMETILQQSRDGD